MGKIIYTLTLLLLASLFVEAKNSCNASFSFQVNGTTVSFTDNSLSTNVINSWQWDFGDGNTSTSQNPTHIYAMSDTFHVCLTIHDNHGCISTFCHPVIVNTVHTCTAAFTIQVNGLTVSFTDASTSSNTITSWQWDFGDGGTSTLQNPTYTYAVADTYHVCLAIHDNHGCSSTFCHPVIVGTPHPCHASFTFFTDSTGLITHFTNSSSGTTGSTTYFWDFGDGTTSTLENPTHTWTHTGHHTVCLFITDQTTGCSSHFCHLVLHTPRHHYHGHHSTARLSNPDIEVISIYPNPVQSIATIEFGMLQPGIVSIEAFDLLGSQQIACISLELEKGFQSYQLDVSSFESGVYIIKLTNGNQILTRKILISNN